MVLKQPVHSRINGQDTGFFCDAGDTLLAALRGPLGLTGTREGCATGECGACTVLLDARPVCSCLVLAVEADNRNIDTIEGLAAADRLHPLQQAFLDHAAVQCGFCTPGLLVAARALLAHNAEPSETQIRHWLAGNLCRCTGYDRVVRAVLDAGARLRETHDSADRDEERNPP